ncbi:MAG: MBL fold metallo-hydrolase [Burkholderiales bacterium]|jgi:phosphoribosyl 1,2-cyclic phosphodiesterase|nr:MBL fold metallo-hydrolase [Burkholderiales bacterium]
MRFCYLGSGSQGNGLVVEVGRSRVLLDCGFTLGDTVARLARAGLTPEDIDAVVVTHEHDDHVGGVARFARRHRRTVWATRGTLRGREADFADIDVRTIDGYRAFAVGDIEVRPYPVPHDAAEPAQMVFGDGARRLGVITDAGCSTPHIEAMLSGCDALALECNHDRDRLMGSAYPYSLKLRITGRLGHLDNGQAAALLAALDRSRLQHVVAVHLSQQNNAPELARAALAPVLGCAPDWIAVADQAAGLDWRDVR